VADELERRNCFWQRDRASHGRSSRVARACSLLNMSVFLTNQPTILSVTTYQPNEQVPIVLALSVGSVVRTILTVGLEICSTGSWPG
jgi:hypothetical protein